MDSTTSRSDAYLSTVRDQLGTAADHLPGLVTAVVILLLGWVVARLARRLLRRLAVTFNRFLERAFPRGVLAQARISTLAATLLSEVVFWTILLVTVNFATDVAGLSAISGWLDRVTANLPHLLAGIVVVVVGYILSVYIRDQIAPQETLDTSPQSRRLGRIAQALVVGAALIVALDQIGIDVALLIALSVIAVAALLTGLAVAFALGARNHVSNLLGMRSAGRHLSAGVRIRVGDIEGEILDTTPTRITLGTERGTSLVPGRFLDEYPILLIAPENDGETDDV